MASIFGSVLSSVIPSVLGGVLKQGVETLGQVAQDKIRQSTGYKGVTFDNKLLYGMGQKIMKNTQDIQQIKNYMQIE